MKEVLYCAERDFLERYLKERASVTVSDIKAISGMYGESINIYEPGSAAAVDEIYKLDGDTAHIKIKGPLSPEGPDLWDKFWGYDGASYITIQAAMERAKNDPAVKRAIIDVDSPGGTLAGCDETWQVHKALAVAKTTEVHTTSRLASAAYWISTPANKIFARSCVDLIGSIGVLVATYDWSKWEENIGIKEVVITSSNAPDKYPDIATQHGRETIKNQLDAFERIFYSRITESRGYDAKYIAERFGRGGMMVAGDPDIDKDDAVRVGMIDGVMNDGYIVGKPYPGSKMTEEEKNELAAAYEDAMKPGAKFFDKDGRELSAEECEETRQALISMGKVSQEKENTPATAGLGGSAMTLQELLAQNPAAKVEMDNLIEKAREEARAEYSARVEKVMPIIQSAAYPNNIKTIACNVLAGKEEMAAFTATVAVFDSQKEAANSAEAQAQTAELGSVTADAPSLKNESDVDKAWAASIADAKARREKAQQEVA